MIRRSAGHLGLDTAEPKPGKIEFVHKDVDHANRTALNIQGRVELLPVKPGETLPGYDKLEFKMVRSDINGQAVNRIVCEGIVVDPPKRRR